MKKIAIATNSSSVAAHFGHCDGFTVYTITAGPDQPEKMFLPNPGHKPGFLPNFLHEQGIAVIIAGGMGAGAVDIFQAKGIEIFTGAQGGVDDIMHAFCDGTLSSAGTVCHEHGHNT